MKFQDRAGLQSQRATQREGLAAEALTHYVLQRAECGLAPRDVSYGQS